MRFKYKSLGMGLVVVTSFALSGCSNSTSPSMMSNSSSVLVESVSPADGATGVPLQTKIAISFTQPMDTSAVRENFHLIGGESMRSWMSSVRPEFGFDHMSDKQFSAMMGQLDSRDISGDFVWSPGLQDCEFITDSAFAPQEEYMLIMDENGMMNRAMSSMGMMNGDKNVLMYHFGTRGR